MANKKLSREELLEQIQNNNDEVGLEFQESVEEHTQAYKQGRIHHIDYIKVIENACEKAREQLIPY